MTGFDRVLVPLDGSARAESALRWVHLLPAREFRLLRVCREASADQEGALRYLDDVAGRLRLTGSAVESRVATGEPAEAIVDAAADSDLIVMSTQGAGGGGRLLYGSVADRVARHAPVPTLLARGGALPIELAPLRRLVVPLDGSPAAEQALPLAMNLAGLLRTPLHLITIDEAQSTEGAAAPATGTSQSDKVVESEIPGYLERLADRLRDAGIAPSLAYGRGEPAIELLARVIPGDLLVMTTHGRGTAHRWQIGTVAERLLRQAAAPLVLIRVDRQ